MRFRVGWFKTVPLPAVRYRTSGESAERGCAGILCATRVALVQMGLTQVIACRFWLVEQRQHFQMGRGTARQFPVNGIPRTQAQQGRADRCQHGKLSAAVGHLRRADQRAG